PSPFRKRFYEEWLCSTQGRPRGRPCDAARTCAPGGTRPFAALRAPAGAAAVQTLVASSVADHDRAAVGARRRVGLIEERRAGLHGGVGGVRVARREND